MLLNKAQRTRNTQHASLVTKLLSLMFVAFALAFASCDKKALEPQNGVDKLKQNGSLIGARTENLIPLEWLIPIPPPRNPGNKLIKGSFFKNSPYMPASSNSTIFLSFGSRETYETFVQSLYEPALDSSWKQARENVGFRSLREVVERQEFVEDSLRTLANEDTLLVDRHDIGRVLDFTFASVLTADGIVQIEDWIYRLDKANETVYAIQETEYHLYNDLINNAANNVEIRRFTTDDDVLDAIEQGNNPNPSPLSSSQCDKAKGDHEVQRYVENINKTERLKVKHVYQRSGLWVSLFAKSNHAQRRNNTNAWWHATVLNIEVRVACTFTRTCQGGGQQQTVDYNSVIFSDKLKYVAYSSTRSLNQYNFNSVQGFTSNNRRYMHQLPTIRFPR